VSPATNSEPSAETQAALAASLEGAVERGDTAGVVALVVDRDGVLFEGAAGQLDVAGGAAMPTDAIFTLASMTKPVTSVAAMMLYEQGELDLDDPVSKFLPGFDALEVISAFDATSGAYEVAPATSEMTVRHLLSHTSGIGYAFCNATVARLQQSTQRSELGLPLLNEPGAEWHYSASTRLLGQIIESITDQTLEELFQENIFEPLGMTDTSFAVPLERQSRLPTLHVRTATGGLRESPQNAPSTPTAPFGGDGGLYSTAHDYGRFMRMFLNGGELDGARILRESSVALMGENQLGPGFVELQQSTNPGLSRDFPLGAGQDKFGLGFQLTGADSAGASRSVGSMAWAGIFNTEFWIDPRQGIAATLLMQVLPFYDEGAIEALQDFESSVYRELGSSGGRGP
jgi:CubicO group peptidase (beta-lactamase class C family)